MASGLLEVHLVSAKGLKNTDFIGKIDPYVVIQYKTQEQKSSVARGEGKNPTWDEKFTFKAEYPGNGKPYKVILRLMDRDTFSRDDFLGQAIIYVEELLVKGVEKGTAELPLSKYRVVDADETYRGEIQVALTFTTTNKVENGKHEAEYGGWKQSGMGF